MKRITVQGSTKFAMVDDEDYPLCLGHSWSISNGRSICARIFNKTMNMPRVILNDFISPYIDHIDGDVFNNQKSNLRIATAQQNAGNRRIHSNNTSGYKGVHYDKERGTWIAQIKVNGKYRFLGRFKTKEIAAKAYNRAAIEVFGEFAKLNEIK